MDIPKIKVLVVDNSAYYRNALITTVLREPIGFSQIRQAGDGLDALETAGNYQPDLIFVGNQMRRGPDGPEICAEMRQQDNYGRKAVILGMAFDVYPGLEERYILAGANGFFPKDTRRDDLCKIIEDALEKHQQQ